MESLTVNPGSVPTEAEATAALEEAAKTAPTTTEEALAARQEPQLPPKFKSTEDLLKAYQELERKLGSQPSAEETEDAEAVEDDAEVDDGEAEGSEVDDGLPEVINEDDVLEATEEEADDEEVEPAADDEDPLSPAEVVEYLTGKFADQDGQLTDSDYQIAEEMGYDRSMVDAYIQGQRAAAELADLKINEAAGGKDNLEAMLIWAATGLTPQEIDAYNSALADNDVTKAVDGIAKLRERYESANGRAPKKLLGGSPVRTSASVFSSWAEVTKAMGDPRYGKDHAYTQQVAAKLGRSTL